MYCDLNSKYREEKYNFSSLSTNAPNKPFEYLIYFFYEKVILHKSDAVKVISGKCRRSHILHAIDCFVLFLCELMVSFLTI